LPAQWQHRLAGGWKNTENGLFLALQQRAKDRSVTLRKLLDRRQADEQRRITENLERFAGALRDRLADADTEASEFALFAASVADPVESAQLQRDRESWRRRLASLPGELDTELHRIATRYADPGTTCSRSRSSSWSPAERSPDDELATPPTQATGRQEHLDWLSLTDVSGPFLTVPVLTRVWPTLEAVDRPTRDALALAHTPTGPTPPRGSTGC